MVILASQLILEIHLLSPSPLHWRDWSNEYVIFDEFSGATHSLDLLTACTLLCIEDGATDLQTLIARVSEYTSLSDRQISDSLPSIFEQLTAASLIKTTCG